MDIKFEQSDKSLSSNQEIYILFVLIKGFFLKIKIYILFKLINVCNQYNKKEIKKKYAWILFAQMFVIKIKSNNGVVFPTVCKRHIMAQW